MTSRLNDPPPRPAVHFDGVTASNPREYADLRESPEALGTGLWAVLAEFDGRWHAWRFDAVNRATPGPAVSTITSDRRAAAAGRDDAAARWTSSLDRAGYEAAVTATVEAIRRGRLEQVNLGRILHRRLPVPVPARALHARLAAAHPSPYGGYWDIPAGAAGPSDPGAWLVSASPELAIEVDSGRIAARPIKGTARTAAELLPKDGRENELVAGALAAELAPLCRPGSVRTEPAVLEHHPGLVHLVARVSGALTAARPGPRDWMDILTATQPPCSVAGVPRAAALDWIGSVEPVPRGPYCGQFGWIDADAGRATLAAGIRIFWHRDGLLHFGTGAGITAGSTPAGEWAETELKARRLVELAEDLLAAPADPADLPALTAPTGPPGPTGPDRPTA
ncbi:chorismate-binding protein [Pseudactinotalea sp. HY158]|uniref:chorismate-binding protein n=1 Tax=Pseudactinotalea sp. HY158 TaxID=2654547 RepID=UPI001891F719|nr:chorismate-binding protein [Pseudactinotalea sp. HY158]